MLQLTNFIDGQHVAPKAGRYLDVVEPATGDVYAQAPDSQAEDVEAAVAAAQRAFAGWSAMPAVERAAKINRLADLIERNLEELAQAESKDAGKPITHARHVDIARAVTNFRFFAGAIQHTRSEMHDAGNAINYTLRRPRGVAGLISPWNLPLYLLTWKIAPAIASGNTCVAKPSEVTPVTAWMLSKLIAEAGIPPGVVNIIHGTGQGAGASIVTHPNVPAVSFTGSTAVGKWIAEHAGAMLKRVSLELGGKNPLIVFEDADLDVAVPTAARAAFSNQGQICLCGARVLVHRRIADEFITRYVERARAIKPGDPKDDSTEFGALVSETHLAKVQHYVDMARALGGTIHCGGGRVSPDVLPARCKRGAFFAPTVITGLPSGCQPLTEEIFGPVATIEVFDDEAQALKLANATPYGLAATVFTRDLSRAHRVSAALDAGIVWVNCWMVRDLRTPFGGAKQSGVGREGGEEALRFFTEPKNVCVSL